MAGKAPAYTVIKDTREQDGYTFEAFTGRYTSCKGMIVEKLDTGDYSLEGLEDRLCIERKGRISELAINLGKDKARFMREIERMKEFEFRFLVLEFSLDDVLKFPEGADIPERNMSKVKITGKYILKMLIEIQMNHNIPIYFCDNKRNAKYLINSIFKRVNERCSTGGNK
jgi:predicted DNA-binding protein